MPITPPVKTELTSISVTVFRASVVKSVRTISMSATASPVRMASARMGSMTSVVPATRDIQARPVGTALTPRIVISARVVVLGRSFSTQTAIQDLGMNCSPTRTSQNSSDFTNYLSSMKIG